MLPVKFADDPLTPGEHLNLGLAYEQRGEFDLALAQYRLAARGDFTSQAELYIGNAYFAKGDAKNAEIHYRLALNSDAEAAEALNNLAWLLLMYGGNLEEAETLARKAVSVVSSQGVETPAAYLETLERIRQARGTEAVK